MYAVKAYFHPALLFQREQKHACRLWRSHVMLTVKNRKFCKIRSSALVGAKNRKFRNDLLKNREIVNFVNLVKSASRRLLVY